MLSLFKTRLCHFGRGLSVFRFLVGQSCTILSNTRSHTLCSPTHKKWNLLWICVSKGSMDLCQQGVKEGKSGRVVLWLSSMLQLLVSSFSTLHWVSFCNARTQTFARANTHAHTWTQTPTHARTITRNHVYVHVHTHTCTDTHPPSIPLFLNPFLLCCARVLSLCHSFPLFSFPSCLL